MRSGEDESQAELDVPAARQPAEKASPDSVPAKEKTVPAAGNAENHTCLLRDYTSGAYIFI